MALQKFSPRDGVEIAYHKTAATDDTLPGVVFCGGFMSDMTGSKAVFLEEFCKKRGQAFLRFDYTGHGSSSGKFTDGTIGSWTQDALDAIDNLTEGPQILIGSSMGGWVSMLVTLARPERIAGLIGIAAAPDFTEEIYYGTLTDDQKRELDEKGIIHIPSDYGEPYPVTEGLVKEARRHLLLGGDLVDIRCPIRLLHGKEDTVVPWGKSLRISKVVASKDVEVRFLDSGDHSLSCEEGLKMLGDAVAELTDTATSRVVSLHSA
tara:strand:+ start:6217 stop:7005 length:789 start_codon:yes stop_codon:yes gene_type:complete